jgi:hypothetical protein
LLLVKSRDLYLDAAKARFRTAESLERDAREGASPYYLFKQYSDFHGNAGKDPREVARQYEHLRDQGLPSFANVAMEKEILFYEEPIRVNELLRQDGDWEATGTDPFLIYALPEARQVSAILVKVEYLGTDTPTHEVQAYWKVADEEFNESRSFATTISAASGQKTFAVPVGAMIDTIRIDPISRPGRFRIAEMYLVSP